MNTQEELDVDSIHDAFTTIIPLPRGREMPERKIEIREATNDSWRAHITGTGIDSPLAG